MSIHNTVHTPWSDYIEYELREQIWLYQSKSMNLILIGLTRLKLSLIVELIRNLLTSNIIRLTNFDSNFKMLSFSESEPENLSGSLESCIYVLNKWIWLHVIPGDTIVPNGIW